MNKNQEKEMNDFEAVISKLDTILSDFCIDVEANSQESDAAERAVSCVYRFNSTEIEAARELVREASRKYELLGREMVNLKGLLKNERSKLKDVKESLAFRAGQEFVNGLSIKKNRLIRLPLAFLRLVSEVNKYRVESKARSPKSAINGHMVPNNTLWGDVLSNDALPREHWPRPNKRHVAFEAMKIMAQHGVEEAIQFFDFYSHESQRNVRNLFLANKFLHDDATWLHHVNSYLGEYGLSPIALKSPGSADFSIEFSRIYSPSPGVSVETDKKISIIMPAYNAASTIGQALDSLVQQTWKNIEVIVVDDCSDDDTWEIISSFSEADSRVRGVRNKVNVGPYVSKNIALKYVTGDFLTGHDADDWAHPERIERQVSFMLSNENIKVCIGRMLRMTEARKIDRFAKIGKTSNDGAARIASISCMFETTSFKQFLGAWDCVRFGGDSELIERANIVFGDQFVTLDQITMICLDAEGSLTNHPEHGVNRVNGISPSRAAYRDAWMSWHREIDVKSAKLEFPQANRRFEAPDAALVPDENVRRLVCAAEQEV